MKLSDTEIQELIQEHGDLEKQVVELTKQLKAMEARATEQTALADRLKADLDEVLRGDVDTVAQGIYESEIGRLQNLAVDAYLRGIYLRSGADTNPELVEMFVDRYRGQVTMSGDSIGLAGYADGEQAFIQDFKNSPTGKQVFFNDGNGNSQTFDSGSYKTRYVTADDLANGYEYFKRTGINLADPDVWDRGEVKMQPRQQPQTPKDKKAITQEQAIDWAYLRRENISLEDFESGKVLIRG